MRVNWRIIFGLAVSVAALALILRNVSLTELASALANANYLWLIPAGIVLLISMWTRGLRWRALLDNRLSPARSFWIQNAGNLLNNVLPRARDKFGRPRRGSRNSTLTTMQSLSTVLIERLLDVLAVFAMLMIV